MENLKHFKNLKTSKKSKISKPKKILNTERTLINDSSMELNGNCECQTSYNAELHNKRKKKKPKIPKHKEIFKE